jgi:hypothetical protein
MKSEDLEEIERACNAAGLDAEFNQWLDETDTLRRCLFQAQEAAKDLARQVDDMRTVAACLEGIGEWLAKRKAPNVRGNAPDPAPRT